VRHYQVAAGDEVPMPFDTLSDDDAKELYRLSRFYWREARRCEKAGAYLAGCVVLGSALGTEVRPNLIVRIAERYLADFRKIFAIPDRINDPMYTLDVFVRAGWPDAKELTFGLGEIWR